jgi:hypothetical protein
LWQIVTENHHRKQRVSSLPCQYHSWYWDYFCLPLDIFKLFRISCVSLTLTVFLTWHRKVEISFTPLTQYFCMITLDSALSLSAWPKKNYPILLGSCFFCPIVKFHPSSTNPCSEFLSPTTHRFDA